MTKFQYALKSLRWLPVLLIFSAIAVAAQRLIHNNQPLPRNQQDNQDLTSEIKALHEEIRHIHEQTDTRLKRIEEALNLNTNHGTSHTPALPPTVTTPTSPKNVAQLSVCSQGCDFNDLQKAVDAVTPNGNISVAPEINGTCAIINKPLHLIGKQSQDGHRAHLVGGVCEGKAPLITAAANITIEGFEISDISVGDGNGACVRLDPGTENLTIKNIVCHNSQDGLLGDSKGHFLIEDSRFISNGFGEGQAHGMYIGGDDIVIRRCTILSTQNAGHSIKSGARSLTVEDSIIAALNSRNSRAIDLYSGGHVLLSHNIIQQGTQSDNSDVIGLALEASRLHPDGHELTIDNNWIIFDDPSGRGVLLHGRKLGAITVKNNTFVGLKGMGLDDIQDTDNHWYESREEAGLPEFDGTASSLPPLN